MFKRLSLGAVLCNLITLLIIESYASSDDPFVAAGRSDPQLRAVCFVSEVSQALDWECENIATGFLVDINGKIGVLTVANINPILANFFLPADSVSIHKVLGTASMQPDLRDKAKFPGLKLLFLDRLSEGVTPLKLAGISESGGLNNHLKIIGHGLYYLNRGYKLNNTTQPIKVNVAPSGTTLHADGGITRCTTATHYHPEKLETHVFLGFNGAPVINQNGNVESIVIGLLNHQERIGTVQRAIVCHILTLLFLGYYCTYVGILDSSFNAMMVFLSGFLSIKNLLREFYALNKSYVSHLWLQSPAVQEWLRGIANTDTQN